MTSSGVDFILCCLMSCHVIITLQDDACHVTGDLVTLYDVTVCLLSRTSSQFCNTDLQDTSIFSKKVYKLT